VRQRRIGLQAEGLTWQVALKLDAPLIRQASQIIRSTKNASGKSATGEKVATQRDAVGARPDRKV